ncbi:MAG: hypothetical protein MUE63_08580 [Xanthomonadales bacterium]|jgi:hypothetical protein|nr:hypothetical protein [Xanthomonadales bacterium]
MGTSGTEYNVELHYLISDNKASISGTNKPTIFPDQSGQASTVDSDGNITIGKKDTAFINFHCDTPDWSASAVQIKGKNHKWGDRLSANIQNDCPAVDADTGMLCADASGVLAMHDVNAKGSEVDYRVQFTDGTNTLWSDPRIKDVGQ